MRLCFGSVIVVSVLSRLAISAELSSQPPSAIGSLYEKLMSQRGEEYLAARRELLATDKAAARTYLQSERQRCANVVEGLCVDAVLLRLKDEHRLEVALTKAFATATEDRSYLNINPERCPDHPRPYEAATLIVQALGDDSLPFATECLLKGLTTAWGQWKADALVQVIASYGRRGKPNRMRTDVEITPIRDARAGQVLLRLAAQEDGLASTTRPANLTYSPVGPSREFHMAAEAAWWLKAFATSDLLRDIEATRKLAKTSAVQSRLERAAHDVASELQYIEQMTERAASQPSSRTSDRK